VLALSALSGLLATCCLALLWCLIAAPPGATDHKHKLDSNVKQLQPQQQQEREQISVYDEAYLPALDRLPAAMSQCIATRSQLPSTADLAAACVAALWSTPWSVTAGYADAITAQQHFALHVNIVAFFCTGLRAGPASCQPSSISKGTALEGLTHSVYVSDLAGMDATVATIKFPRDVSSI